MWRQFYFFAMSCNLSSLGNSSLRYPSSIFSFCWVLMSVYTSSSIAINARLSSNLASASAFASFSSSSALATLRIFLCTSSTFSFHALSSASKSGRLLFSSSACSRSRRSIASSCFSSHVRGVLSRRAVFPLPPPDFRRECRTHIGSYRTALPRALKYPLCPPRSTHL